MFGVWIGRCDDDRSDASRNYCVGARRCSAMSAARFEGNVEGRAFWIVRAPLSLPKCFDFRVRFSRAMMPSPADDLAGFHKNSADHWIGRGHSIAASREPEGEAHSFDVLGASHFHALFSNSASANCLASKG